MPNHHINSGPCSACNTRPAYCKGLCHPCYDHAHQRAYYLAHRETILQRTSAYERAHRGQVTARHRRWRNANRERVNAQARVYARAYRVAHRVEVNAKRRAYHSRVRQWWNAQRRVRYALRLEDARAANRIWRAKHRAGRNAQERQMYPLRREGILARNRVYHRAHPEIRQRLNQKRRALQLGAFVESVSLADIRQRDRAICGICGKKVARADASLDHILPLSRGGLHEWKNARLAHRSCNSARQNRGAAQLRLME